jgi:uncharacterized damage-inducible protein DinB
MTSPPTILRAADTLAPELRLEAASTRALLERVPQASLGWKPHAKSRTAGDLAAHIAGIPYLFLAGLERDEIDRAAFAGVPADDVGGIVEAFDRHIAEALRVVGSLREESLLAPWRYRYGDRVIFEQPRFTVARAMGINHMIHHRGQLGVYLRLLDVPLPPVYGPTADAAPTG